MAGWIAILATVGTLCCACRQDHPPPQEAATVKDPYVDERRTMVATQMAARDIVSEEVLEAMRTVLRHRFVPRELWAEAYADRPLPIGHDQTISQPYIVAYMTQALLPLKGRKVLEIGTGSGYQAAVLAEMGAEVYSIEIVASLAERARATLVRLGYQEIHLRTGDGYLGWPEAAPFDAIILTAAPPEIPAPLLAQLGDGGRLVAPVGRGYQTLVRVRRKGEKLVPEELLPVRFVPMTGRAQEELPE